MAEVEYDFKRIRKVFYMDDRNQMILGEQSRAAERFTRSEFHPIPPKGTDLRLLWPPLLTANSLALEHSMAG